MLEASFDFPLHVESVQRLTQKDWRRPSWLFPEKFRYLATTPFGTLVTPSQCPASLPISFPPPRQGAQLAA